MRVEFANHSPLDPRVLSLARAGHTPDAEVNEVSEPAYSLAQQEAETPDGERARAWDDHSATLPETEAMALIDTVLPANPDDPAPEVEVNRTIPGDAALIAEVYRLPEGSYLLHPEGRDNLTLSSGPPGRKDVLGFLGALLEKADGVDPRRPVHRQVAAYCPITWRTIAVDTKMRALIEALWGSGVMTYFSCQDWMSSGNAWIEFAEREDADWFADLCRQIVQVGSVNVTYHRYHNRSASVEFPKAKIREVAKAVREEIILCNTKIADRGAVA